MPTPHEILVELVESFFEPNRLFVSHLTAATILELHKQTLRRLGDIGEINYHRKGTSHRRYTRDGLIDFLERGAVPEVSGIGIPPLPPRDHGPRLKSSAAIVSTPRLEASRKASRRGLER